MATMNLKVAGSQRVGNAFDLPPEAITIPENASRYFDHDDDSIDEMVRSYEDRGQDTPIRVRKSGKDLVLTFGQRRLKAAVKYNSLHPKKPMLISVIVDDDNDEDAFNRAVDENKIRKNTSVVDDAFAMKVYRDKFKWKDTDIAKKFGVSPTKVSFCKKITTLRRDILAMVHNGELAFDTAVALADFSEGTQDEILALSTAYKDEQKAKYDERMDAWMKDRAEIDKTLKESETNGKQEEGEEPAKKKPNNAKPGGKERKPAKPTTNEAVKESIRKKQAEAAESNGKGEGKPAGEKPAKADRIIPPTFSGLKTFLNDEFLKVKSCPEPLATLVGILMEYMTGAISDIKAARDMRAESKKYTFNEPSVK